MVVDLLERFGARKPVTTPGRTAKIESAHGRPGATASASWRTPFMATRFWWSRSSTLGVRPVAADRLGDDYPPVDVRLRDDAVTPTR